MALSHRRECTGMFRYSASNNLLYCATCCATHRASARNVRQARLDSEEAEALEALVLGAMRGAEPHGEELDD